MCTDSLWLIFFSLYVSLHLWFGPNFILKEILCFSNGISYCTKLAKLNCLQYVYVCVCRWQQNYGEKKIILSFYAFDLKSVLRFMPVCHVISVCIYTHIYIRLRVLCTVENAHKQTYTLIKIPIYTQTNEMSNSSSSSTSNGNTESNQRANDQMHEQ